MVSFHKWRQEKNFHDQSQFFHIDNPFPMTKNHNNKLRDPERAPTSYPPSTASSTGFSISSQMLNSTLPIPLPTRPTAPGTPFDSTIVWTHFEMESSKKVVNKSGMFGTHKPTFIPIIMNLKFKKLRIHRKVSMTILNYLSFSTIISGAPVSLGSHLFAVQSKPSVQNWSLHTYNDSDTDLALNIRGKA